MHGATAGASVLETACMFPVMAIWSAMSMGSRTPAPILLAMKKFAVQKSLKKSTNIYKHLQTSTNICKPLQTSTNITEATKATSKKTLE